MNIDITILYYTDNRLNSILMDRVQQNLLKVAEGKRIVSVSQKPISFGENICVGNIGRSWLSLYKQLVTGLAEADTKYVAMAEHDIFYSPEHFKWTPPKDDIFYYNENVWLVQWTDNSHRELRGMYSRYWKQRLALSQLICNRKLYLDTLEKRLDIIDKDRLLIREIDHIGEPGLSKVRKAQHWAKSGRPVYLKDFLSDTLELERYDTFQTKIPNLDVRHDSNFTGAKRGRKRCYDVPYWGKFEDLM